jgi:ubiquinol-cytochrome c reductase cytochrome b subunit
MAHGRRPRTGRVVLVCTPVEQQHQHSGRRAGPVGGRRDPAILEGFAGYSLVDDLLSGMGLVIAYSVALSIPFIGAQLGYLIWGGPFPGSSGFLPRLEIVHVLLIPAALTVLITLHLISIMRQHHTQFPGVGRRERNVVGTPLWPAYALRSIGLVLAVAAVLFLAGGLIQINPIWQWGPYHPYLSENGAQPDWYIGWLIGALRLMPNFEPAIGNHTIIPNPFWGGAAFPLFVFAVLYSWPWLERRITGDHLRHDLLDRPRDRPNRTAVGAAFLSWVVIIFAVGSTDRLFYRLHISYSAQIHFWRVGRVGAANPDLLHHPQRVPLVAAQWRPPAALVAGRGGGARRRRKRRALQRMTPVCPSE